MNEKAILAAAQKLVDELKKGGYDLAYYDKETGKVGIPIAFDIYQHHGSPLEVSKFDCHKGGGWEIGGRNFKKELEEIK